MIVWVDVETTGLDPDAGHLLEVGLVITDEQLVAKAATRILIAPPSGAVVTMSPEVKTMHEDNGLWAEARQVGVGLVDADLELNTWLRVQLAALEVEEKPIMAGSSVHFDRAWLKAKLPALEALFHYRNLDVSTLKELNRHWPFAATWDRDRKTHRALPDIEDSVEELRHYLTAILGLNAAPGPRHWV